VPDTVFAADVGGTKVACAVVGHDGRIHAQKIEPLCTDSIRAPIAQIVRMARELGGRYVSAGVAVPGLARRDGSVWAPNIPGWERMPAARLLQQQLRVPVRVESDRNAVVLGEAWRGAAKGKQDAIVLIVGTGIGAGILSGGRVVRGAHELSGCAGWMALNPDAADTIRTCGELEALAAGPAVAAAARRAKAANTTEDAAKRARSGNTRARRIFERAGTLLGLGVANLISLFDPEVVVLTGGLTQASDLFLDVLKRTARERCQPLLANQVQIRVSRLQAKANLLGAAKLAWEQVNRHSA
jgi:glucokinase